MTPRNCFHRILPPTAQSRSGGWLTFLTFACLGIIGSISGLHADDAPQPPRRIFVPTENLDALLSRDRGGVVLTQDEFTQLLQDAGIAAELSSPDTAVLTAANYTARIDGEQLVVSVEVQANNFTPDWQTLPLRVGGLGIESAQVGDEAALVTRGDPPELLHWLLRDAGPSTLTLEASLPLEVVGSDRVAIFDLAGAPSGELKVTLPAGKHLQIGGVALKRPAEAEQQAEYVFPVGGHKAIELRITDRASESRADVLTFASTAHGLFVSPGEVTWTARTTLQVIGRKIDRLIASVPRGLEITAIESTGLESWELADLAESPTRTTITLNWRQGFDGARTITFRGIAGQVDDSTWTAPNLFLEQVTSHTGVVEVQYPAGVRVQPRVVDGARAAANNGNVEPSNLAPNGVATGSLRYDVFQEDFDLTFGTEVKARELHVAMTNLLDVTNDGLMLFTLVDVSPLFDNLFELQLTIPAEWEVQELSVTGNPVVWRTAPVAAGVNEHRIPLDPPLAPGDRRSIRLVARRLLENWPVEQTPTRFSLPEVKLPQATVVEALYGVTGEADLQLTPVDVTGLDPAHRKDLETLEKQIAGQGRTLRLGYAYQDTIFSGQIEAVRKPTRLSAATLTFVELDRETVNSHLETQVRVEGGGAKELRVSLPEEAGLDLRFNLSTPYMIQAAAQHGGQGIFPYNGPRIVEQKPAPPENGRRVWTLKLDRRLYGDAVIWTEVRLPRGDAQAFTPIVLEIVGAERQNGHIAVVAGLDQRVSITATDTDGQPLPLVDPVDFPGSFTFPVSELRSGRKRIVASVQYLQPGYTASITDERFDRTAMPTAVCQSANYETVVSPSGELQHEATYRLIAVGVQSLSVQLPEGNHLWAALVDGVPVEVRQAGETLSLPLPPVEAADQVREVTLLYRGGTESLTSAGSLRQTPPLLSVVTGRGDAQPLEVLEQNWVLHHSPDTLLLSSDGRFHTDGPMYAGTFLGRLGEMWSLPTPRQATEMVVIAAVILAVLLVVTFALKRFGLLAAIGASVVMIAAGLFVVAGQTRSSMLQVGLGESGADYYARDAASAASAESSDFGAHSESVPMEMEYEASGGEGMGGFGGGGLGLNIIDGAATDEPVPASEPAAEEQTPADRADRFSRPQAERRGVSFEADAALAGSQPAAPPVQSPEPSVSATPAIPQRPPGVAVGGIPTLPTAPPSDRGRRMIGFGAGGQQAQDLDTPFQQGNFGQGTPAFGGFQSGNGRSEQERPTTQPGGEQGNGQQAGRGAGADVNDATINFGDDFATDGMLAQSQLNGPASLRSNGEQAQTGDFIAPRPSGALLSLALALAPPDNFISRQFRYVGAASDPAAVDLDVAYADRRGSQMLLAAAAAGVLLLLWWLRNASVATRGLLAVATIGGPFALASIVPAGWLVTLDGILIGGVIGVALWIIAAIAGWVSHCCGRRGRQNHETADRLTPSTGAQSTAGMVGWFVLGLSLASSTLRAEEPAPPVPPPLPEEGRPIVIIPYEVGSDPLAAEQVLVPQDYYLQLWKAARPDEQPEGRPPVDAVVASALYNAQLEAGDDDNRTIKVEARFVLRHLVEEGTRLTLPLGRVAVESATLEGQPSSLTATDDGAALQVVLTKQGLQVLDVVFRIPATNVTDASGRFTLPLKPVPSGRLAFSIPGDDSTEVRLNGDTDAYRIREADGQRTLETFVDVGGDLTVAWRPQAARGAGDGTVQVESTIGATVDDSGLTVRHRFRYVVSQGALSDVSYKVPAGVSIKRISGADVAGWEQADEADGRILKVFLRRDVDDSTALDLDLFRQASLGDAATTLNVPTLEPTGVTREQGDLALFAEPQLGVQAGAPQGLRQVNVANFTMDAALTQPGATARFAYRFSGRPFDLPVTLTRRQPETRVTSEHGVQVLLRKLHLASRFQFDLREAPRANLSFQLPADYLALDVQGDYLVDWSVLDVAGGRVLTVELDQPRTGRLQVLLEATLPRDPTAATANVTLPQPLAINRQDSQLGVWIDDAFTATVGDAGDWRSLEPQQLAEVIRQLQPSLPQFGFRSTQSEPGPLSVALRRAEAQLSAEAVILAAASDASLDYGLTIRWRIDQAAADQFVVTTPGWLGDQIDFDGTSIRQIESFPRADGSRAWRITLHEPVRGEYLLSAIATLPLPTDDAVKTPDVRFLRPDQPIEEATELALQRRFLVLVNLSSVHRVDAVDADVIVVADREQLPLTLPDTLLNQAVEIASLPVGRALPEWKLVSTASNQAAAATVLLADLRTVLSHDGSWRTQANYRVRNRGRQFLAIVPPTDSRLLSVLVAGRPSQATRQEQDGTSLLLVPLPATSAIDLSFDVRIVLAGRLPSTLPSGFALTGTEMDLPAPQLATTKQSPDFGVPVLQTLWRVDVPADLRASLVESAGRSNLTPGGRDTAVEVYNKSILDELKTQLSLSLPMSKARFSQGANQLRNLDIALNDVQAQTFRFKGKDAQEREDLIARAERQLEELQQQAAEQPSVDLNGTLDINSFGRKYILDNNRDIIVGNGGGGEGFFVQGDSALQFNFGTNAAIVTEKAEAKPDVADKKSIAGKSRAAVKEQLGDQELSYFNSPQSSLPQMQQAAPQVEWSMPNSSATSGLQSHTIRNVVPTDEQQWRLNINTLDDEIVLGAVIGQMPNRMDWDADEASLYDDESRGEWSEAGGLSLPMDLPHGGEELTFTKVGGDPQLTLAIRPRDTETRLLGLLSGLGILIAGGALVLWITRGGFDSDRLAWGLLLIGLLAAALFPAPARMIGLLVFIAGAGWLLVRRVAAIHTR